MRKDRVMNLVGRSLCDPDGVNSSSFTRMSTLPKRISFRGVFTVVLQEGKEVLGRPPQFHHESTPAARSSPLKLESMALAPRCPGIEPIVCPIPARRAGRSCHSH